MLGLIQFIKGNTTTTTYSKDKIDTLLNGLDKEISGLHTELNDAARSLGNSITSVNNSLTSLTAEVGTKMTKDDFVGSDGLILAAKLPSFVDDVLEYASLSAFPSTGETGKIYVDLSTNKTYRWGGTTYTEISPSIALGETSTTAYAGSAGRQNREDIDNILNLIEEAAEATTLADYGITDAYTKTECDNLFATTKVTKIYESDSSTNYKTYADIKKLQDDMQKVVTMEEDEANDVVKITF